MLLIALGYVVAVLAGLVALVVIYIALANLPGAPDYFSAFALPPVVVLAVPPVAVFVVGLTFVLTAAQTLVAALFSEFFQLRNVFVHALFGAVVSVSGFVSVSPTLVLDISGSDWADIAIVGAAGLVGGLCYWLIAGRGAGFKRTPQALPQPYPAYSNPADSVTGRSGSS